jgi:hypothetical protein
LKRNNYLKCKYVFFNRNFHSNINVLGRFYKHFLTSLYKTRNKKSWTKATLLRIYFRNLSVQRSFLPYKSQCLKKVNVKYVINRLWHEIFHIVPGISPRPISALQLRCRSWYGSIGLIPGPIWKMLCNNLLIFHIYSTITLSSVLKPKYSLSTRNKCIYLLEASETIITIWRQECPHNCYI